MKPITQFRESIAFIDEDGDKAVTGEYANGSVIINNTILATSEALEFAAWITAASGAAAIEESNRLRASQQVAIWRKSLSIKRKAKS